MTRFALPITPRVTKRLYHHDEDISSSFSLTRAATHVGMLSRASAPPKAENPTMTCVLALRANGASLKGLGVAPSLLTPLRRLSLLQVSAYKLVNPRHKAGEAKHLVA